MNIDNLNQCKKILETELSNNLKSNQPIYQTRLSYLIDDLRSLISLQLNPELHNKLKRLSNGTTKQNKPI